MKTPTSSYEELLKQSYKKLKSSAYFDRTNPALREQIVTFEKDHDGNVDAALLKLQCILFGTDEQWNGFVSTHLNQISAHCYPKKLYNSQTDARKKEDAAKDDEPVFISNVQVNNVCIDEFQYMADLPVEFHILGVLWLLLIGYKVDAGIYDKAYGNRIRKKLRNEFSNKPTYSPYLFEPYFEQYQSWRDTALEDAQNCLKSNQDVAIITLDLKRYFYSIDITREVMDRMTKDANAGEPLTKQCVRLNNLIADICHSYAKKVDNNLTGDRNIAPIGFLPSCVISNWFLTGFDRAISDGWNPVYYGRYVDDILIVDKVEKNSEIFKDAKSGTLKPEQIIEFFLLQCSRWKGLKQTECTKTECIQTALLSSGEDEEKKKIYRIQQQYLPQNSSSEIYVQNEKVKIFYFAASESDALLRCFQSNIAHNASEFRFMPEEDAAFKRNDYSELYELSQKSINKLRDVSGIDVDKFSLSKFLGKYLRIGGLVCDTGKKLFEKDIKKIMNAQTTIINYTMWEKVIEILVVNEQFDTLLEFCENTLLAINGISCKGGFSDIDERSRTCKKALRLVLKAALTRELSLCWKETVNEFAEKLKQYVKDFQPTEISLDLDINQDRRHWYLKSRMSDKAMMAILPDFFLFNNTCFTASIDLNLTRFSEVMQKLMIANPEILGNSPLEIFSNALKEYQYPPYMITMYDLSIAQTIVYLLNKHIPVPADDYNKQWEFYLAINYHCNDNYKRKGTIQAKKAAFESLADIEVSVIKVGDKKMDQLKVALANVQLKESTFVKAIDEESDRTYRRYEELSDIINQAIKVDADMLVIPEAYTPFEWLSTLARVCARNNLAIISGVEHIVVDNVVYNLTATILPFQDEDYSCAQIFFHLKNHYAPFETKTIKSVRLKTPDEENTHSHYELFNWNDCWFPVYCCYELCSIRDRAIFQSYADILVAVEWNKDVNHYSNVLESLGRDLHCYCVQANSSNYGDSRIFAPTKKEQKDILRTKGGQNATVLVETVNIKLLRDFQFGIKKDNSFKPIPPQFDLDIIAAKRKHKLYDKIIAKDK